MKTLTIDHVTRIEGHAKITIRLADDGSVNDTQFHVTQVRGFEKFTEGRPFYEMPAITSRICGICPVSHSLASVKACDAIMAVQIPDTATKLRELLHCAQFVQSHALSFFHLSAPDFLLGMDSDPAHRNILGIIEQHPDVARNGVLLRKFGQSAIEALAKERVHPAWAVPGGVNAPLTAAVRDQIAADVPRAKAIARKTIDFFKSAIDNYKDEIEHFGNMPTMYLGLTDSAGTYQLYDGLLCFRDKDGRKVADRVPVNRYPEFIGEAAVADSYLKAPFYAPLGYPEGMYRVGPLARLNVVQRMGTLEADTELSEYRERFGEMPQSSFLYHYARLIELVYALERMELLLNDPKILGTRVRAKAGVNAGEGVGVIEAPRGTLIHHYKVDETGAIRWANLIVATGHNNMAMSRSIGEVARHYIDGTQLKEGMLNRVSAVVRAYDPCLSCSTHDLSGPALRVQLVASDGRVLDEAVS